MACRATLWPCGCVESRSGTTTKRDLRYSSRSSSSDRAPSCHVPPLTVTWEGTGPTGRRVWIRSGCEPMERSSSSIVAPVVVADGQDRSFLAAGLRRPERRIHAERHHVDATRSAQSLLQHVAALALADHDDRVHRTERPAEDAPRDAGNAAPLDPLLRAHEDEHEARTRAPGTTAQGQHHEDGLARAEDHVVARQQRTVELARPPKSGLRYVKACTSRCRARPGAHVVARSRSSTCHPGRRASWRYP